MPNLFTNLKFYATADGTGLRKPTSSKFEDEVIVNPPVDPIDPVDPTDPTTPVDPPVVVPPVTPPTDPEEPLDPDNPVLNPDVVTSYDMPTLSRKNHTKDIFVKSGDILSITYLADKVCTLIPKLWFEDVREIHSADGKSVTIEWQVPDDEPGRSMHVGVKAEYYGSDTATSNNVVIYDRLHINKTIDDLIFVGIGEAVTTIQAALNSTKSGQTLIIRNGTYQGDSNKLFVGNDSGVYYADGFESGKFTRITAVDYMNSYEYKTTRAVVSKYTTVMAEDPLQVILDGQHVRPMGYLSGKHGYYYFDRVVPIPEPGRELVGVEVTGFVFYRNFPSSAILYHTERCGYFNCAAVNTTVHADNPSFNAGDSPTINMTGGCEQKHERHFMISNSRMGMNTGHRNIFQSVQSIQENGALRQWYSAYESDFSKVWFTPACIQFKEEDQSYGIEHYGGMRIKNHNLFAIDNAFYVDGMRTLKNPSGGAAATLAFCTYQAVNTDSELLYFWGIGQYNSGRPFIEMDTSTDTKLPNTIDNYLAVDFKSTQNGGYGPLIYLNNNDQLLRGTLCRTNAYTPADAANAFNMTTFNTYKMASGSPKAKVDGMLLTSIAWNYDIFSRDTVFWSGTNFNIIQIGAFAVIDKPPNQMAGIRLGSSNYSEYTAAKVIEAGAQHPTKVHPGSPLDVAGVGCRYHFATKGRYLSYYNDKDSNTIYENINWLSRSMWERYQVLNRLYVVTSNGLNFNGNQGWALDGVHPIDYINRHGPTPSLPSTTPYIDDIYGVVGRDLSVTLLWRPVCPAYRSTIMGYHVYMNGLKIVDTIDKAATKITMRDIKPGEHTFNLIVIDPTYGNSGFSKPVKLIVPNSLPPIAVPDPTDPNSGGDNGGYIGDLGDELVTTVAQAPRITRKAHTQDIFVQSGQAFSVVYVINGEGTLLPKGGYEDMTVEYSQDGREMKLSWLCPIGEPGDSLYIGAEVWGYGTQDSDEAVRVLWDRLHVNKSASDIIYAGPSRTYKTITAAAEALMIRKGMTLVMDDGYHTSREDWINFGFVRDNYGSIFATVMRGDLEGYLPEQHTYDSAKATGKNFQAAIVKKHAVFMSATPCGAILDRAGKYGGVNLYGNGKYASNYQGNVAGDAVEGVKVVGFAIRNATTAAIFNAAQRVGMSYCSYVQDLSYDDTLTVDFTGGGSCVFNRATAYTLFENNNIMGNSRMLCGNFYDLYGAYKSVWRANIATSGCIMFDSADNISQTYTNYGAHLLGMFNCWALDSAYFATGYQLKQGGKPIFNYAFVSTNGVNNNVTYDQCLSMNDVRGGFHVNMSGKLTRLPDYVQNSVAWNRIYIDDTVTDKNVGSIMAYGSKQYTDAANVVSNTEFFKNVTLGRNPNYLKVSYGYSLLNSASKLENMLFASPTWSDLDGKSSAEAILQAPLAWAGNNAFISNYTTLSASTFGANPFVANRSQAQDVGFKYVSRIEESSTLEGLNVGCKNIFAKVGRYGKYFGEAGYDTRYDGIEKPYVNALSRMPWLEFRHERQQYLCRSKGVTYSGKVGWAVNGGNPVDYINRFGTTPEKPLNCPYIEDWYVVNAGSGRVRIAWRPLAPIYRKTVAGYKLFIDGVDTTHDNNLIPKNQTAIIRTGISPGERKFNIVVVDPTHGNSGFSRTIKVVVV